MPPEIDPTPRKSSATDTTRYLSSTMRLPADVARTLRAARAAEGLSTGDYIILAIESTVADGTLPTQLHPRTVGGELFASRHLQHDDRARDTSATVGVWVRLLAEDFAVIDRLVTDLDARSRPNLISAAVRAYAAQDPFSQETQ